MWPHNPVGSLATGLCLRPFQWEDMVQMLNNLFAAGAGPTVRAQKFAVAATATYTITNNSNYDVQYEKYTVSARRDLSIGSVAENLMTEYAKGLATSGLLITAPFDADNVAIRWQQYNLWDAPGFLFNFKLGGVHKFTLGPGKRKRFRLIFKERVYDTRRIVTPYSASSSWNSATAQWSYMKNMPQLVFCMKSQPAGYLGNLRYVSLDTQNNLLTGTTPTSILQYDIEYKTKVHAGTQPAGSLNLGTLGLQPTPAHANIRVMQDNTLSAVAEQDNY